MTRADGTVLDEIAQGRIGTKITPGTPSDKYLYDTFAYDSPLEQKNIIADIEEVIAVSYTHLDVYKRQVHTPVIT